MKFPSKRISGSLYNKISTIDKRYNTENLGFIENNKRSLMLIPAFPIDQQLSKYFYRAIDSSASNEIIVLQLRKFSFAASTSLSNKKGYFYFKASLFGNNNNKLYRLGDIDTVLNVELSHNEITLFTAAEQVINNFFEANLDKQTDTLSARYSINDIKDVDNIEKSKMPLYNSYVYTDGIYESFESFANQAPDVKDFEADVDIMRQVNKLKRRNANGKMIKVNPKDIYGFVYKGFPYVANSYGFYPLKMIDSEFYFIGYDKMLFNEVTFRDIYFTATPITMAGSTPILPIGFFDIFNSIGPKPYKMMIDHTDGSLIHITNLSSH